MGRQHVDHKEIAEFARNRVNLPRDQANAYRAQAKRLRDKIEAYVGEHPDFTLKKMLLSGSLAKGTALRSLNDIDVACYISGADAPSEIASLLTYLAERLRQAFPNFTPDQVSPQTYSVAVSFKGSGLDVDIVPILYDGDPDWYGNLVSQDDGSFMATCIPRHLEFIRLRKNAHPDHFAQVVRLIKYWVRKEKSERHEFRLKSFMIEMILSKLADQGMDLSDYPEAMQHFMTYIARNNLSDRIIFTDYYPESAVDRAADPIQIFDPVNPKNNVCRLYSRNQADEIVNAAIDAGDAIDAALAAPTKQESVRYWQKVFGSSFQG